MKNIKKIAITAVAVLTACILSVQPAMAAEPALQGIDVSSWQPSAVTERVAGDFAIVKLTQGTSYVNSKAGEQLSAALRSGKEIGVYHYASGTNCTEEADFFTRKARPWLRKAVLALDWEQIQNADWGSTTWSTCFVKRVQAQTGVMPMVYVQASALWQVQGARNAGSGLWVAQYASMRATGYQSQPWRLGRDGEAMRQYTSSGLLAGYSGYLDLNLFRGSRQQWRKYANPAGAPVPVAPAPSMRPVPAPRPAPAPRQQTCYTRCVTVRRGDSLSSIAARYGGSWRDWHGYRSGNPNRIYVGERVCKGGYTPARTTATGSTHTVRRGETLSRIAARYGTSWQQLASANGLRNPNLIHPGQRLVIRRGSANTAHYNSQSHYHIVARGETLSGIASRYGESWQQLAAKNGLRNPNRIYPGQRLLL